MLEEIKQLLTRGEAEEALRLLRPLAAQQPRAAEVHLCLSEAYFQLGAGPRAVAAAREAVRLARRDPAAHYQLGRILSAQGQWAAAETALQQALKLSPGYAPAQAELDRVRQALGESGTLAAPSPSPILREGEPLPASSRRLWVLALMGVSVMACCAAIVFATLQPRWTGGPRPQGPHRQATTPPLPPMPQARPVPAPAPAAPQPSERAKEPLPPSAAVALAEPAAPQDAAPPPAQVGPTSLPPQGGMEAAQSSGSPGGGEAGTGGLLVDCPLCSGSGWMICPYCLISGDPKCEMCGGRRQVVCWLCGGKGQARRLPNGEIVDTVGDHMPTETIPNEAIRQAVERYRKTGEMPPEIKAEVEKFLKQFRPVGGEEPTRRPSGP